MDHQDRQPNNGGNHNPLHNVGLQQNGGGAADDLPNEIDPSLQDHPVIVSLGQANANFLITNPRLAGNPIVYASDGFLELTGYPLQRVLGRNCRFMQGPDTDPRQVARVRQAVEEGTDVSVCLLNYRVDGTTFHNQLIISAIRNAEQQVLFFVGAQMEVTEEYAQRILQRQDGEDGHDQEQDENDDHEFNNYN